MPDPVAKWYVARTRAFQEAKLAQRLAGQGVEVYLPLQRVKRQWSDRVKIVDTPVMPGHVFVRCSERERRSLFERSYGLCYFLMDRTCSESRLLTIPDKQMEDFMLVVKSLNGSAEITISGIEIGKGDMVRVVNGPLSGFVCECVEVQNKHKLIIRLGLLGAALVEVEISDVIKEA